MINYPNILFLLLVFCVSCKESSKTEQVLIDDNRIVSTTYYFIRHAEKDLSDASNRNPHLTEDGKIRAQNWVELFSHVDFNAVYTTNFHRTRETARPTAQKYNLNLKIYNPAKLNISKFLNETQGKHVLVVGHSETIPGMVNSIIKKQQYSNIDHDDYATYFIVNIDNEKVTHQKLSMP